MTTQFHQWLDHLHTIKAALIATPLLLCATSTALAQSPSAPPSVPSDAPPVLERLEEGAAPNAPQPPTKKNGVTESRTRSGAVKEIEVRTGASTYYLRPNTAAGSAQPGDQQSSGNRAAQFKVKEFDLGGSKTPAPVESLPAVEDPSAAPMPPVKK